VQTGVDQNNNGWEGVYFPLVCALTEYTLLFHAA
jgi:hypothetical protein